MKSALIESARGLFAETFGGEPAVYGMAPGRVELLGNHTDYNGGLVLSAAIDRRTIVAGRVAAGRSVTIVSANLNESASCPIDRLTPGGPATNGGWTRYVQGVIWAVHQEHGPLHDGFEAAIVGDVPIGAGLSSSASLQAAAGLFLLRAGLVPGQGAELELDDAARMAWAHLLRRSENEFVGVNSGLLDQFSALFGRAEHALLLDCRSLDYQRLPLGSPAPAIVVCDSRTARRLADGMYNLRREECERVVTHFAALKGRGAVRQLRDLTLDDLNTHWDRLDPAGRLRARHVLTENERVRRGAQALACGELAEFGRLLTASHESSRDDFENSSPALDALVDAAAAAPGFLGAKLSGAGWAGCTVNLVAPGMAEAFAESVRGAYFSRMNILPEVYICQAADGASAWQPP